MTKLMQRAGLCMAACVMLAAVVASAHAAAVYEIDTIHSSINFGVKHLMVATTTGTFSDFSGTLAFDSDARALTAVDVTIQTASIDTRNGARDDHLRNPDFLDVTQHPAATFRSTAIVKAGDMFAITGELALRGVTQPVTVSATMAGPVAHPGGGTVLGLEGTAIIDRRDFDITWNKALDAGGWAVGNEITISIALEAIAAPAAPAEEAIKEQAPPAPAQPGNNTGMITEETIDGKALHEALDRLQPSESPQF